MCEEWHNYQNFKKWYNENYPSNLDNINFDLDKDLRQIGAKNKVYSPDTVIFLPDYINTLIVFGKNKSNTSGYSGISKYKNGTYRIKMNVLKKTINIYSIKTLEEAIDIYKKEKQKVVDFICDDMKKLEIYSEETINLIKLGGIKHGFI